jgi:hypothetical protein
VGGDRAVVAAGRAVTPLEELPAVLHQVGDRAEIHLDGGIRSGADVIAVRVSTATPPPICANSSRRPSVRAVACAPAVDVTTPLVPLGLTLPVGRVGLEPTTDGS